MRRVIRNVMVISLLPVFAAWADDSTLVKDLEAKIQAVESKRSAEEKAVQAIDRKISSLQHEIRKVRVEIERTTTDIRAYEKKIEDLQERLAHSRQRMNEIWVGLYKGAFIDMVNITLSRSEYSGYVHAIMRYNLGELEKVREIETQLLEAKDRLDRAMKTHKQSLKDLEAKIYSHHAQREKKERILASLSRESRTYSEEMKKLLERLKERSMERTTGIFLKKGALPWPVNGTVLRGFGRYTENGFAQISNGIDIQVAEGSPVLSVYKGKVVFYNWINKFGNTMILDHGEGYYSVYGHLQEALRSPGQDVGDGEVIGVVGQTGDVTSPMLHFEIRFHDKPQDPGMWLLQE
ncbi:MAG: murein hydrolase activator EnvC family protein [Desulfomonilia bacterium]